LSRVADDAAPEEDFKTGFVLALHATGAFSSLDNGLFLGGRASTGTIWGVGLSFAAERLSGGAPSFAFGQSATSSSTYGLAIYPGVQLALARAGRVDLAFDVYLGFTKYFTTDRIASAASDGYGVWTNVGPGLRLWLTPSLAFSYSAIFDVLYRGDRAPFTAGQAVNQFRASSELTASIFGRFGITAVF